MDFTHNVLPSVDLNGQEDHGVATVTNATIGDDISILEELGNVSERQTLSLWIPGLPLSPLAGYG